MITADTTFKTYWFAKDGTYTLGEQDSILIDATNLQAFQQAIQARLNSLLAWKKGAEYFIGVATTIEEVEAIDTVYHG
jgi:hypothetical protein